MLELFSKKMTGVCVTRSNCYYVIICIIHSLISNENDVITSLEDIYDVGTFVQITELHEVGNRMRMIIQGHRRCVKSG